MVTSYTNMFILKPTAHKIILGQKNAKEILCRRCGKRIHTGDKVVSKLSAGRMKQRTRYYHNSCYEAMYIDI